MRVLTSLSLFWGFSSLCVCVCVCMYVQYLLRGMYSIFCVQYVCVCVVECVALPISLRIQTGKTDVKDLLGEAAATAGFGGSPA